MRMSRLFGRTLRAIPAEAEMESHKLLLRAAMIKRLAAGIYSYLPLAWRVMRKIEYIIREEMDAIGGQEINMPVVQPAEIWQESGRWFSIGSEMARFRDRSGRDMALAMTHEEVVTDLARKEIESHRQLPLMLYQIQTKFRDEPRARGGLIRVREFIMKDAYSFHVDQEDLDRYYPDVCRAYLRIFRRCGVNAKMVLSDVGMMGGSAAHEFMALNDAGEDTIVFCGNCGYAANREVATLDKTVAYKEEPGLSIESVATPDIKDIAAVSKFLRLPESNLMKTMVYVAGKDAVLACIRGDLEVNERKLANALLVGEVRLADEDEIREMSLPPGYLSPVGIDGIKIIVDDSILPQSNYATGANQDGYHFRNVRLGRDFTPDLIADISAVRDNDICTKCGSALRLKKGIEAGNTFKLGLKYSQTMGANFLDANGISKPIVMGCYGIGVGRLLSCVIEENHDENGIVWPFTVAPYHIHLISLGKDDEVINYAAEVYDRLTSQGHEVLFDDRDASAGVKFNDADLLGMPIRITVSKRTLKASSVEIKLRRESEGYNVPGESLDAWLRETVKTELDMLSIREAIREG